MNVPFIDLKTQYLALKNEIDSAIFKVLDHGAFVNGPEVKECEAELAKFSGAPYAVACASGTDALLMALMASGIQAGDEVITTPFTFIATLEAIVLIGATPVLVDIDPKTFNINPELIHTALTSKTKAIMPVSLYGQIADMKAINLIAKENDLIVIEDAAQSFGATQLNSRSCSLSRFAATSFFPAKPLGCYGDGGAVFCQSKGDYDTLLEIRDHGSQSRYYHTRIGINGRLDTLQCAILLQKLKRYQWELNQRDACAKRYNEAFTGISNITPPLIEENNQSAWAQYTIRVKNRDKAQNSLKELGIPTAIHYPMSAEEQPAYKNLVRADQTDQSKKASREVLSLPIFPDMSEASQARVIEAVLNVAPTL